MPWWVRVFQKILDVAIYGIAYDIASLVHVIHEIFDETKLYFWNLHRSNYGKIPDIPDPQLTEEDVWINVSLIIVSNNVDTRN